MKLAINSNLCPQNHKCPAISRCPVGAITQNNFDLPKIDNNKCIKCQKCINFCPMNAFYIEKEE